MKCIQISNLVLIMDIPQIKTQLSRKKGLGGYISIRKLSKKEKKLNDIII